MTAGNRSLGLSAANSAGPDLISLISLAKGDFDVDLAHSGMPATQLSRAVWRKSQRSNPSGNCVQVAFLTSGEVALRNSRHPDGPALVFTAAEWNAFLGGAQDGDFGRPAG